MLAQTHHIFIFRAEPILLAAAFADKKGSRSRYLSRRVDYKKAISKVRLPKSYRHPTWRFHYPEHRTIHEASFMSNAKSAGVMTPYVYFVDPAKAEIIMEFIEGQTPETY